MAEGRRLDGWRVIVTGASRGIGRAIAIACAAEGATVGINFHRSRDAASSLADQLGAAGVLLPFDVGNVAEVTSAFDAFVERTGGLDALVNNAAVVHPSLLVAAADEDVGAMVRTNLLGTVACTRAALPVMLRQRRGVIVNVGSIAASRPCRGQAVYAATKAAVQALAAAVDVEYARKGIRCEWLAPGPVDTDMLAPTLAMAGRGALDSVDLGELMTPEVVAAQVVERLLARNDAGSSTDRVSPQALYALMSSRRSIRRFTAEMPPREAIESVLAAAVTAPSASNKQPWRFIVVSNAATITRMADAVRGAVDRIARVVDPAFEPAFRAYGDYFTRFEHAPIVIVPICRALTVLSNMTLPQIGKDDAAAIAQMERDSGLIGTSLAVQNLLLAAHAAGLGASGMTGPLVAVEAIRGILDIAPSWHVVALVPIGYADEQPEPTARKAAARVTQWIE